MIRHRVINGDIICIRVNICFIQTLISDGFLFNRQVTKSSRQKLHLFMKDSEGVDDLDSTENPLEEVHLPQLQGVDVSKFQIPGLSSYFSQ